jgi:hypothetical protein
MLVAANNNWFTVIHNWTVPGVEDKAPTAFSWVRGLPMSGNLASLAADDGNYLVARSGPVFVPGEAPAQLEVDTVAPSSVVYGIDVSLVGKVNTPGLAQRAEAWNYVTGTWVLLGQLAPGSFDGTQTVAFPGNAANYLEPGTNRVKVKFSWFRTGAIIVNPWTVSVDQVKFSINSA